MTPGGAPGGRVDLRSDTVTQPTPAMRKAMAEAEVGDDGYGEDPTVAALQDAYAERVGKQAALFVPSGTMANQLAVRLLAPPGTLVVAGHRQHVVVHEGAAAAALAGVQIHGVDDTSGMLVPADVAWAVAAVDHHWPRVSLVCVENTHMPSGGRPWTVRALAEVRRAAVGLPLHMDGARLFNAEISTGVPAAAFGAEVTTVMSCLSKGLGAPVGSLLAGPDDLIASARQERHRLGGAMRQSGVLAAAGLVALRGMVERLVDDHARARRLAVAVADRWPDAGLDPGAVATNIVVFPHTDPGRLLAHLRAAGILAGTIAPGVVRLVTHLDIDDADVERAMAALATAP